MSFTSPSFLGFVLIVLAGAAGLRQRWRMGFLTLMSFVFYAWAYPPHVLILLGSCLVDYRIGRWMSADRAPRWRSVLLMASITVNVGLLATFKYAAFLASGVNQTLAALGLGVSLPVPTLVLPLGISFYTFEALSYTVDVYRRTCRPARSFLEYAMFISWFPRLMAGPIVRAAQFLPQIPGHRPLERPATIRGVELVLAGYFKKCVVADNCSSAVTQVFNSTQPLGGAAVWAGALLFSAQIYADFSGYSDIARGLSKLFGFDLPANFRWPYFSGSVVEFWRRWHITLSSWIRDYLYLPLGGRSGGVAGVAVLAVVWFLCGLWHGAAYTFIAWGLYHGLLVLAEHRLGGRLALPRALTVPATFAAILISWVLFRSPDLATAARLVQEMLWVSAARPFLMGIGPLLQPLAWVGLAAAAHALSYWLRYDVDERPILSRLPYPARAVTVAVAMLAIVLLAGEEHAFIYFQF